MIGGAAVRRLAARFQGPENRAMPKLEPDQVYQLLRHLTSPVVAITCQRDGKRNGMISDSAVRASIAPTVPRLSVYIHKFNFSHALIFETGRFVLHLLRDDQFELIHRLGFESGRARDKLAGIAHRPGTLGVPVLDDCYAHFECSVVNVMDTGRSCGGTCNSASGYGSTTSIVCPDWRGPATRWRRPDGQRTSIDAAWSALARPK